MSHREIACKAVIPAQAGIQEVGAGRGLLDSRLRGNDGWGDSSLHRNGGWWDFRLRGLGGVST